MHDDLTVMMSNNGSEEPLVRRVAVHAHRLLRHVDSTEVLAQRWASFVLRWTPFRLFSVDFARIRKLGPFRYALAAASAPFVEFFGSCVAPKLGLVFFVVGPPMLKRQSVCTVAKATFSYNFTGPAGYDIMFGNVVSVTEFRPSGDDLLDFFRAGRA